MFHLSGEPEDIDPEVRRCTRTNRSNIMGLTSREVAPRKPVTGASTNRRPVQDYSVTIRKRTKVKIMKKSNPRSDGPRLYLVETLPVGVEFVGAVIFPSIGESLIKMFKSASHTIDITSIYVGFNNCSPNPSKEDSIGNEIYKELLDAADRGVRIRIIVTYSRPPFTQPEAEKIAKVRPGKILVGFLDMHAITSLKNGIQHSKLAMVDGKSFYIGSANSDWRAYSQVCEVGLIGEDAVEPTLDLGKVFDIMWYMSYEKGTLPKQWDEKYRTLFNRENPMCVADGNTKMFFSVSPNEFVSCGRDGDADSIVRLIDNQSGGVLRLCAMQYSNFPLLTDMKAVRFWGNIDIAMRKAAVERGVTVLLMVDIRHLKDYKMRNSLRSLDGYDKISVKAVDVPELKDKIPFTRLLHSKLVISDTEAWIGTNNLVPEYFLVTAGVGCHIIDGKKLQESSLVGQLRAYFDRYYDSAYAVPLRHAKYSDTRPVSYFGHPF